jgi:hypothetical protein
MIKQNHDPIAEVIEEKFTRCPRCRHYSVKQTDELSFSERIKAYFVPLTAYKCDHCSYRFVDVKESAGGFRSIFFMLVSRFQGKLLLVAATLAAAVVAAIILVSATGGKKAGLPVVSEEKTTRIEQKQIAPINRDQIEPTTKEEEPLEERQKEDTPEVETTEEPVYEIVLGNSNRFGVNWSVIKDGVQITRMSEGPLKKAGLRVGDIFREVDDQKITDGNSLLRLRNEIFSGRRTQVLIKVYREGKIYLYKMVRYHQEETGKDSVDETRTPGENAFIETGPETDAAGLADGVDAGVFHVFSLNTLKTRASAPDTVSEANRWRFAKKKITVRREAHQHVVVAGDAAGTGKWAVDDRLIVNGKNFEGLCRPYEGEYGYIPGESRCLPLDITSLVPPNRDTVLTVELADHGIRWGNTDIYIVIK